MDGGEIIIIGAGIGGLAAALGLQRAGFRVAVYEQADELGEVGAGLSLSPTAVLGLKHLGVFDEFRNLAYAPDYQVVRHYKTGRILAEVSRGEGTEEKYGARYYVIHRADLHGVLARAVAVNDPDAIRVSHRFSHLAQDSDGVTAMFENGAKARGDALIAADGVRSRARSLLFGAEEVRFTGFVAWRGLVPMERVPIEALDPPSQIFIGPQHMINRYPVRGGKLLNFVALAESSGWEEEGWSIPAKVAELAAEFKDWHPWVTQLIEAVPEEQLFKWALCARSALMRWVKGRATVLGDAAHPILPYLGHGAVLAIEDAVLLARAFAAAPDVDQALHRYEAARVGRARFVVERSTMQAPKFQSNDPDSFHHDTPVDEALGLFNYDPRSAPV
jgi:salicylate hydroxylase